MPPKLEIVSALPPVIPAFEAAVRRGSNPLRVTQDVAIASRKTRARPRANQHIFDPARPPPGVVPEGTKLAMDEQSLQIVGWAAGQFYQSAFAEGTTFLGYAYLSELAQRAEYRAISETIAYEMTREGIEIKSTGREKKTAEVKKIEDAIKRFRLLQHCGKAAIHDGFFGRGHLYIDTGDTDDPQELKTSIGNGRDDTSKSKVSPKHPIKAFRNVEPVWTYPTRYDSQDPLKESWYHPTTWFVMGKEVHESRLFTFIGREVPDLLKPAYSFGGLSMTQMAKPYVDNWLRTRQAVADIVWAFSVFVLKTNLAESLQNGGEQLFARAELFNNLRNNRGLLMLDKDAEEFDNVAAPLSGLEQLQAQAQEHMAAVSRIPIVKLLGIQPAGLNASSEGEIRSFYDWIAAYQEHLFRTHLTTAIDMIQLSEFGDIDPDITFEFKQLWQLDEAGRAAVVKTTADTHDTYVAMGAISPEEVREALASDPDSPYQGLDLSGPAPGEMTEGEVDELGNPIEEQTPGGTLKPHDPGSRLASSLTSKAANFGGAVTGGFKGDAGSA